MEACPGDDVRVIWNGKHNIRETESAICDSKAGKEIIGFREKGHQHLFKGDELVAQPGETRYFKCDSHCGYESARFEVHCPRKVHVHFGFDKVTACVGDSVEVFWKAHTIYRNIFK